MSPVEFDTIVPVDHAGLQANVRHALTLRLPELRDFEYPRRDPLHIVANGPSARDAQIPKASPTLALNGALKLREPTWWAACDPQPIVAEFASDPPPQTVYLVASKCHPSVFERLQGRQVVLWHVYEDATARLLEFRRTVSSGVSITNTAFELATHLGFREFHTWGWDGCYVGGRDHATPQPHKTGGNVTITVEDRVFSSTHEWALEAQDMTARLVGFPFPIHIHGPGMFAAALQAMLPNRIATDYRPAG